MTFEAIAEEIRHLSIDERKRLITLLVDSFTEDIPSDAEQIYDIMDFAGIGRHLYDGTDAQDMVNEIRREWDDRP
jgi:hypothetical protein